AANGILELRKQRNEEISEFDCLQFCDKRDLAASSESIRNSMNLGSAKAAGKLLRRAERLRDRLAHSQANLAGPDPWPELAQLIQVVESSLATSDAAIEELVRSGKPLEPGLGIAV